jgi:hypothetical protein
MTASQLKDIEREAREIQARRLCTCCPCLRAWAFRAAGILALLADLYAAHRFGAF